MRLSREKGIEIAHAHADAEARGDLAATLATLDPEPVYEFQPGGRTIRGMEPVRAYYDNFFKSFQPKIASFELRSEWVTDEGLGQEFWLDVRTPEGSVERHCVMGILLFGERGLAGERIWASDRLLSLMVGEVYERAQRLPRAGGER